MKKYEGVFIFVPNLEEEVRKAEMDRIRSIVESFKGTVEKFEEWGQRRLAYEIKKTKEGYYAIMNFTSDADAVNEIDRISKINEKMLRHMITKDER
ncbi:MAG TPA: 30S ribosomal protein S6 [Clostridiales bacterium]|nr:30S ribosomal protein S6 [Clostridiales bacterium]